MKRRWMYVILAMFFTVFFLYSCTSPTTTNSKEVTIVVDRTGVNRNATLILAQDGLNGDWEELTGSGGIYKFTVDDPNGVYSVAAVDDPDPDYEPQIQLFHSTLAEARTITLELWPDDTDFATLTVNVPAAYATENVSVFFLKHHEPNSWLEDSSTTVNIPKGKGTLVAIISDREDSNSPLKVYIKRDFNFLASGSLTISSSDLKNPAEDITDDEITYSWLLDKTLVPGHLNWNATIPETLINSTDKYLAEYMGWDLDWTNIFISWWKVTKDVPVTIKDGVKALSPATTTISATAVENNLPEITFVPYTSPISEYKTRYYNFDLSAIIGTDTYPTETHSIFITPGYLAKVENVYKFPNITLTAWKDEYKPVTDYVVQSLGICLSPNTIDEINSLKVGTEWTIFYSYLK